MFLKNMSLVWTCNSSQQLSADNSPSSSMDKLYVTALVTHQFKDARRRSCKRKEMPGANILHDHDHGGSELLCRQPW